MKFKEATGYQKKVISHHWKKFETIVTKSDGKLILEEIRGKLVSIIRTGGGKIMKTSEEN